MVTKKSKSSAAETSSDSKTVPVFGDRNRRPTPASIASALGRSAGSWQSLLDRIHDEHPDLTEEWRYYDDGKSWLLKVARKSKTIFWGSVWQGAFRACFYFPVRLTPALLGGDLSTELVTRIRAEQPTGTLRAVPVELGPKRRVADVMRLIALKIDLK